jgi:hypothetical protein
MAKVKPEKTDIGNSLRDLANESKLGKAEKISLRLIAIEFDLLTEHVKVLQTAYETSNEVIDHLTDENKELKEYITEDVFPKTADVISIEYGRVGCTDKDTKVMEILRGLRLKGERILKGESNGTMPTL